LAGNDYVHGRAGDISNGYGSEVYFGRLIAFDI
jgi:hypothetical protein